MGRGSGAVVKTRRSPVSRSRIKTTTTKLELKRPQWLEDWLEEHGPYLYHGTGASETREKILSEGLVPWNQLDTGSAWAIEPVCQPRPDMVYMADRPKMRKLRGNYPVNHMMAIDLTQLDPTNLYPDEDAFLSEILGPSLGWKEFGFDDPDLTINDPYNLSATKHEDKYPLNERPYANYGQWAEANQLGSDPEHARLSLVKKGLLAHKGPIPKNLLQPAKFENYYEIKGPCSIVIEE